LPAPRRDQDISDNTSRLAETAIAAPQLPRKAMA
jgi:hypothetical protein